MKKILSLIIIGYLKFLTKNFIKKHHIKVVGLTGSAGKSTLTKTLKTILSSKYSVYSSFQKGKGLNSESGVPFAFLKVKVEGYSPIDWFRYLYISTLNFFILRPDYDFFILEMGVDKPNDMNNLLKIVVPDIAIFLSIGLVHSANFEKLFDYSPSESQLKEAIFKEKSLLITKVLENKGQVFLNIDDDQIKSLINSRYKLQIITFGKNKQADFRFKNLKINQNGTQADIIYNNKIYTLIIKKYILSEKNISTILSAIAVAKYLNISIINSITSLSRLTLPPSRMSILKGISDTIIIDSSYNASLPAMQEAVNILNSFETFKKIAILGEMRELGTVSSNQHQQLADFVYSKVDNLIVVGEQMQKYFIPYYKGKVTYFETAGNALNFVKKILKGKEVILIKGSQNTIFLEIIVEGLLKNKNDVLKLCRRGKFWDRQRKKYL